MREQDTNKYSLLKNIVYIFKMVWNFDKRRVILGILNSATVYLLEIYTSIIFFDMYLKQSVRKRIFRELLCL